MVQCTDLEAGGAEVILFKQDSVPNPKAQAEYGAINGILPVVEISAGSGGEIQAHPYRRNRPQNSAGMEIPGVVRVVEVSEWGVRPGGKTGRWRARFLLA